MARTDDSFTPALALTHLWRNTAGPTWQPLGMLSLSGDLTSTRDLRVYADSAPLGRLAYAERRFLLGVPVGVERDRSLVTALALTPALASWLRPRFISSSNFVLSRTLSSREPVRAGGDSGAFILPQTLNNARTREFGASLDIGRGLRLLAGDSSAIGKAVARVRPLDASTRLTRTSTFDLTAFDPSVGYQLGFGGLQDFLQRDGETARGCRNRGLPPWPAGRTFRTVWSSPSLMRSPGSAGSSVWAMSLSRRRPRSASGRWGTFVGARRSAADRSRSLPQAPRFAIGKDNRSKATETVSRRSRASPHLPLRPMYSSASGTVST